MSTFYSTLKPRGKESYDLDIELNLNIFKSYFLSGKAGIGKTAIALQIAKQQIAKCPIQVSLINNEPNPEPKKHMEMHETQYYCFLRAVDLISESYRIFSNNQDEKDEVRNFIRKLKEIDFLILDDLAVGSLTPHVQGVIYDLIDHRYEYKKQTIITSNLPLEALNEIYGERTTSRIAGMCEIITPKNKIDLRFPQPNVKIQIA